jgi:hypothetical protein
LHHIPQQYLKSTPPNPKLHPHQEPTEPDYRIRASISSPLKNYALFGTRQGTARPRTKAGWRKNPKKILRHADRSNQFLPKATEEKPVDLIPHHVFSPAAPPSLMYSIERDDNKKAVI